MTVMCESKLTLFDKIWNEHVVAKLDESRHLIHVDRHILHELTSPVAFSGLKRFGRRVRNPELTFATNDHVVSTDVDRTDATVPGGEQLIAGMRRNSQEYGLTLFDLGDARQGIVHVISPELGIALPGLTLACGDSHTSTVGGIGALAWGIGTSEIEHILATQTAILTKPQTMRVRFTGRKAPGVTAKDFILALIARIGTAGATGYAVEYAGDAISNLDVEERMTICNMSVEAGARMGFIAPDEKVFAYLRGRPYAPAGAYWEKAVAKWRTLHSDADARFDSEMTLSVDDLAPQVSWGTSPEQTIDVDASVPSPDDFSDLGKREAAKRTLNYIGLQPGTKLEGLAIQKVFIGSCTNGRMTDLRAAAKIIAGKKVAPGVRALVVPGSGLVRAEAEAEGLDRLFIEAGFEWRLSGCSMCAGVNADKVAPGERCIATSNRNFEGRQGPGSRTHLASPVTAAAAAIAGKIVDPRKIERIS